MKHKYWKFRYDYQAASWVVYNKSRGVRLRDYFPDRKSAGEAADALNEGRPLS